MNIITGIMSVFSEIQLTDFEDKSVDGNECSAVHLEDEEYRHFDGKSWVLPSVKLSEAEMRKTAPIVANYFFPNMYEFTRLATKLLLGENSPAIKEERVHSIQVASGTAALRMGADFLVSVLGKTVYYYSNPAWDNLHVIFKNAGFKEAYPYRYWCPKKRAVDFSGLLEDLKEAPEGAIIVLQANAHNPTGTDLSKDQWRTIADVMKKRKLIPFFDSAFQGLGTNLDEDAWPIRYFVEQGFELFCAQSFTKNCGLYSERIGNFLIVAKNRDLKNLVVENVSTILRGLFLGIAAPANRIITTMWKSSELTKQWIKDLETMRNRITEARQLFRENLEILGTPGDWTFITKQIGWKSMIELNEAQVEYLANKYQVYLSRNGSFNISAITQSNVEYVAKAIHETITTLPS